MRFNIFIFNFWFCQQSKKCIQRMKKSISRNKFTPGEAMIVYGKKYYKIDSEDYKKSSGQVFLAIFFCSNCYSLFIVLSCSNIFWSRLHRKIYHKLCIRAQKIAAHYVKGICFCAFLDVSLELLQNLWTQRHLRDTRN